MLKPGLERMVWRLEMKSVPRFECFSSCKTRSEGDSVAILHWNQPVFKIMNLGTFSSHFAVDLQIKPSVLIIAIYSPPKQDTNFLPQFSGLMALITHCYDTILLDGGFTIHINNSNGLKVNTILNPNENSDFMQHGIEPSHNLGETLDLVISQDRQRLSLCCCCRWPLCCVFWCCFICIQNHMIV